MPLAEVLTSLGIEEWDFVIFGDASASGWERECGWASVSVERATGERIVWYGFSNRGSVNAGEAMAYLWPAMWLANREADRVDKGRRRRALQVHVVTDSQYVQTTGSSDNKQVEKNGTLWERFDSFVRQGIVLNWHWIRRETIGLNQYADRLSRLVRTSFKAYNMQERMAVVDAGPGRKAEEINPSD